MYVLETNAVIYYLNGEEIVRSHIDDAVQLRRPMYLSAITITELLAFPNLSLAEERAILELLPGFSIISVDSFIAQMAGVLGRRHNIKLADGIIAATALYTGSTLLTRNVRDFKHVPDLVVKSI